MSPGELRGLAADCSLVSRGAVAVALVAMGIAVALNHWAAWLVAASLLACLALVVARLP